MLLDAARLYCSIKGAIFLQFCSGKSLGTLGWQLTSCSSIGRRTGREEIASRVSEATLEKRGPDGGIAAAATVHA
jgi:hypothetical protein